MHKIDTNTATSNNEFTDGDSSAAVAATELNAAWFNSVQRELCNLVTGANISLSASADNQLLKAVQKFGFKPYDVQGGTLTVDSGADGNLFIVCSAENFKISGTIDAGKILIIMPYWTGSATSIRVTYNAVGSYVDIRKGYGFIGAFSNGSFSFEDNFFGFQFPIVTDGKILASDIETSRIKASTVVAPPLVKVLWVSDGIKSVDWMEFINWEVGQVKRIYTVGSDNKQNNTTVKIYDESGAEVNVSFLKNSYREMMCVGSVTVSGTVYAVLKHNGYVTGDDYN